MRQELQTHSDTRPAPARPRLVARFIDELKQALSPIAESADLAAALIIGTETVWVTASAPPACAQAADGSPACLGEACASGRGLLTSPVFCDSEYIGNLAICNPIDQPYLAGVAEYLARAAASRVAQERREESLLEELSDSWESLEAVYEISADLHAIQNASDLLGRIIRRAAAVGDGLRAVLWLEQGDELRPLAAENAADLAAKAGDSSLLRRSMALGSPVVINDPARIRESLGDDPELREAVSLAIMPLELRRGLRGALEVWAEQGRHSFDSRSVRLLQTLALQAAMVIENECLHHTALASERLRQQIDIGSKIQQALLVGKMPQGINGLQVAAFTQPSQEIDGDFYDLIKHSNQCLDVLVGDVMGKGIPAALVGAATKNSFLRAMSWVSSSASRVNLLASPEEIVNLVHQDMTRQLIELDSFATACYARFDVESRQVEFVDCGHTRTIRYWRRARQCGVLEGSNMPLGFSETEIYKQFSVPLEPGDVFLFYSDGVTEARNREGEMFGEARLADYVRRHNHLQPQALIEGIRLAVNTFSDSKAFSDDFTVLTVKVDGGGATDETTSEALEITSDLTELARARAFIHELCQRGPFLPLVDETVSNLELAVTEALSNIMRHAYRGRAGQPIQIEATLAADRISLRLCHHGELFDPAKASPPRLDGSREGGFGLYIIEQLVDELSYCRDERGRACTCLVKRFQPR